MAISPSLQIRPRFLLRVIVVAVMLVAVAMSIAKLTASDRSSMIIAWGQLVSSYPAQPPGNSIQAVIHSQELGFDGIELDVQISKDGHAVLMHDDTLDRTTDGSGLVSNYTLAELRKFSLGKWQRKDVTISTLTEVLDGYDPGVVLIDWRPPAGYEKELAQAVKGHRVIVLAHSRKRALLIKKETSDAKVFLKSYEPIAKINVAEAQGLDGLIVDGSNGIPSAFLTRVRREDLALATFVHEENMGRWHLWKQQWQGVDFILTRRPDWAHSFPL